MSEFIVSSDYGGYIYVGHAQGKMEDRNGGDKVPYFQLFVISPVSTWKSEDYQASGFKAEKKRCATSEVWKDLEPGQRVKLFFDDKQRVIMVALDE